MNLIFQFEIIEKKTFNIPGDLIYYVNNIKRYGVYGSFVTFYNWISWNRQGT